MASWYTQIFQIKQQSTEGHFSNTCFTILSFTWPERNKISGPASLPVTVCKKDKTSKCIVRMIPVMWLIKQHKNSAKAHIYQTTIWSSTEKPPVTNSWKLSKCFSSFMPTMTQSDKFPNIIYNQKHLNYAPLYNIWGHKTTSLHETHGYANLME